MAKLQYQEGVSSVAYRSKISHGKNKKNFQVFSPFEFIVAIAQHIPEPSFQLVRYYFWYSNQMRVDRKKQEDMEKGSDNQSLEVNKVIDILNSKPSMIMPLLWRECIKKVWKVDPLVCPKCTGEMRL